MKPVPFDAASVVWAEDQDEYGDLPAWRDGRESISCWRLTLWERVRIALGGRVWLRQLYFGGPLQPVALQVESPFTDPEPAPEREGETP